MLPFGLYYVIWVNLTRAYLPMLVEFPTTLACLCGFRFHPLDFFTNTWKFFPHPGHVVVLACSDASGEDTRMHS